MEDAPKVKSAHVVVRPSGREFDIQGHDTLLQAGLSAGLHLNYGCANGTCGMCKARVISGNVARVQMYDFPLSEAEKLQGYTLLCAHTAASSELELETLEALSPRDIPEQQIVTRVRAIAPLGENTMLLHLQTPRTNRLRFLAGQTVTLGASATTAAGGDVLATYPIASCPCDDRNLQFYIARPSLNRDDRFAERVFANTLKIGDAITVCGPHGHFVLTGSQRPVIFAACDTGFAPIKGLIEHAITIDDTASISLYWLATRADGHFLANQCRAWSDALDNFHHSLHSAADVSLGAASIVQAIQSGSSINDCDFYLAGPQIFVEKVEADLRKEGVPAQRIFKMPV